MVVFEPTGVLAASMVLSLAVGSFLWRQAIEQQKIKTLVGRIAEEQGLDLPPKW